MLEGRRAWAEPSGITLETNTPVACPNSRTAGAPGPGAKDRAAAETSVTAAAGRHRYGQDAKPGGAQLASG